MVVVVTAVEDLTVAIRTLTELTSTRARGPIPAHRDAADLTAALRRSVPALLAIMAAAITRLDGWPSSDAGTQANPVYLARLINAQPDPHDEQPC
ncbi:hypothetical protein [Cryobacterium sp. PH31-O1]|uniref:hypothetical protein n=1 Tax=Cryobacterium sp. PH31-O1 TaxID=3046306 RepID=UPI0024B99FB7|nr:hypothetical protein [Cryobacterium sp. PH31-O1]MDJ0337420.1 hypothetical protein [Cryobacterium sp. PH31-O1]